MINAYDFDDVQPIDADDIIDVSAFDFTDDETWLHVSTNYPPEGIAQNVPNWLKNRPDLDFEDSEGLGARRSIDTRTFTRPKKRNNRLSFESIMEALSPPSPNVWKKQSPLSLQSNNSSVNKETSPGNSRRESVPAMLRPMRSGMLGASGQESMEAFLDLSQSKGIDSFINLTEPEFADTLMNVSQPSDLSSSLVDSTKDSFVHEESIVDSQILTDSMMKTSMFGDVSDAKDFSDETFLKDMENEATLKKNNVLDDYTFTANSLASDRGNLNSTFNTFTRRSATSLPRHSLPLDIEKQTIDTTFIASPINYDSKPELDETLTTTKRKEGKLSNGFNGTFMSQKQTLETINVTLDLNNDSSQHFSDEDGDADPGSDLSSGDACCNATVSRGTMNSTFNGPTDLRRELLEQVQRSTEQNLDSTYSHASEDVPVVNHNNTYRKKSSKFHENTASEPAILDPPPPPPPSRQINDRKYFTFTKKTNMTEPKTSIETKSSLESLDNTFCKPVVNYKKKLQAPRVLSKVPQLFQKSNPNLASNSLKNFDNQRRSNIPNSKYGRAYRPDIPRNVEGSLINKFLPLGRFKSGSEQRLLEVGGSIKEFLSKGACGSTESIESTQSAHSAPDLDDRLSVCSDSSHTSYNSRVINSAQLHYIARLQEESLKQISTPKPNRRVLENNWVDAEKDLPSPILKGGSQEIETISHALKTSSPLSSPVGSSAQSLGSGHHINNEPSDTTYRGQNNVPRKPEMLVRPMKHSGLENKTRLRAPTNWSAPNRGVGSGIPRPASRIPGPRLSRPNNGNNHTDWKKGCL